MKNELKQFLSKTNIVAAWSEVSLIATRNSTYGPTITARNMYMVHTAMYNVWTRYDSKANHEGSFFGHRVTNCPSSSIEVAISYAAYTMLRLCFPEFAKTGSFEKALGALISTVDVANNPLAKQLGENAANLLWSDRLNDGSNASGGYAEKLSHTYPITYAPVNQHDLAQNNPTFNANRWQPLFAKGASAPQKALTQHWGNVKPFSLSSPDVLRPPAPPRFGIGTYYVDSTGHVTNEHQSYLEQFEEVMNITAGLDDAQKSSAEYWADGPRSETPPGHWFAIAHDLIHRDSLGIAKTAQLLFALGGAVFDASIACWECKRAYDYARPQSSIRKLFWGHRIPHWTGKLIRGEHWTPYQPSTFPAPPFQGYTSGHSTFSNAAAEVLSDLLGSCVYFDGTSRGVRDETGDGWPDLIGQYVFQKNTSIVEPNAPKQDVVMTWFTLQDAAEDAGISRLYGGIHIMDDNLRGAEMGKEIAKLVLIKAKKLWSGK